MIQLSSDEVITLDNVEVGRMPAGEAEALSALQAKLKERHAALPDKERKAEEGALVNLVFDKKTDYAKVEKIMEASAKEGFTQFKFIVEANY